MTQSHSRSGPLIDRFFYTLKKEALPIMDNASFSFTINITQ